MNVSIISFISFETLLFVRLCVFHFELFQPLEKAGFSFYSQNCKFSRFYLMSCEIAFLKIYSLHYYGKSNPIFQPL